MKAKTIALALAGILFGSVALAAGNSADDPAQIKGILKTQVDGVKKLPVYGLNMIEAGGRTFFVSDNGRIVVTGKAFDMWNGAEIKAIDDVDRFVNKVDLTKLGLNIEELSPLTMGAGKQEIVMFVDPNCAACNRLLQAASKMNQYTFKLILLPLSGGDSPDKVKRATCASDKGAVLKALVENQWEKIPAAAQDCSILSLQKSIVTARILGVTSVPYLIGFDGSMQQGAPKDLSEWLAGLGARQTQSEAPQSSKMSKAQSNTAKPQVEKNTKK